MLIDDYFSDERYHLLSACGMVNTHNAAGPVPLLDAAQGIVREPAAREDYFSLSITLAWRTGVSPVRPPLAERSHHLGQIFVSRGLLPHLTAAARNR